MWIFIKIKNIKNKKKVIKLYGDSDSAIMKGILFIIFIVYRGLTIEELIHFNPYPFLHQLELSEHLTYSRSQGIKSILKTIHNKTKKIFDAYTRKDNNDI